MPGWQSMLHPAGPQAGRIETLWWFLFWTAATVWTLVVLGALVGAWRRRRVPPEATIAESNRRITPVVSGLVGVTALVLFAFLVTSFFTGRALATVPSDKPISVVVNGHQWWWEFTYEDSVTSRRLTTANELHVPVGRPVLFKIQSNDVIHSFWAPALHGKRDAVPGHTGITWFQADTPGVYRGQCAEFCGFQHAKMAFLVIAESRDRYERWYAEQLQGAAESSDSMVKRGQDVFQASACIMCHSVQGTHAGASAGPDLTHLASRRTIAAGSLPNTPGNLAGWIVNPQGVKPGALMPANQLDPKDLQALLAYLESLK